jgi:hypothetical protein
MECRLAGETEVLGENLPQRHFCPSQNPTLPDPVLNPDRRDGKPATNHLSYGAAVLSLSGIYLSICDLTASVELGHFSNFLIYTQSVGLFGQGISLSQGRYLHTEHKYRINAHRPFMFGVRFEPPIPVFKQAKTVYALDRAATQRSIIN